MTQGPAAVSLIVRRTIGASAARLFEAWTTADQLSRWWGPAGVRCTHAEVEAKVGGSYRIGNELPDGRTLWISGQFLIVEPPQKLVYTWMVEPGAEEPERVTVRFEARGAATTEVIVVHERIADEATRAGHAQGWEGCLEGLSGWLEAGLAG